MSHLRAWVVVLLLVVASTARAAPTCTVTGTNGPAFSTYDPLSASPSDAAGSIAYSCGGGAKPDIGLSTGAAGSYAPRAMVSGKSRLTYNLFLDAARTRVWGDGSGATSVYSGKSGTVSVPIFGRIPALQDVSMGDYSDTIVVSFAF